MEISSRVGPFSIILQGVKQNFENKEFLKQEIANVQK